MGKTDPTKALADEAIKLGIDPATYDLTLDEHVPQLQARDANRTADINAVQGKKSKSQRGNADGVMTKSK